MSVSIRALTQSRRATQPGDIELRTTQPQDPKTQEAYSVGQDASTQVAYAQKHSEPISHSLSVFAAADSSESKLHDAPSSSQSGETKPITKTYLQMQNSLSGMHWRYLVYAVLTTLLHIEVMVATILLMKEFYDTEQYGAFIGILVAFGIKTITLILFDYANHGIFWRIPFHLFQLSELVDLWRYCELWLKMRHKFWRQPYFRANAGFFSFLTDYPALFVQIYVICTLEHVTDMTSVQTLALISYSLSGVLHLFSFFYYISVKPWGYVYLMIKGIVTTALRMFTLGYVALILDVYIYVWLVLSYVAGLAICRHIQYLSKMMGKDDPLQTRLCHALFGHVVALHSVFFSFPWAPNHSVVDWWHGYIVHEVKLGVEMGLALATIMAFYQDERDIRFYTVIFLALTVMLIHYILLYFVNIIVSRNIRSRKIYSSSKIIGLFARFGTYIQEATTGDEQPDATLEDDELTPAQLLRRQAREDANANGFAGTSTRSQSTKDEVPPEPEYTFDDVTVPTNVSTPAASANSVGLVSSRRLSPSHGPSNSGQYVTLRVSGVRTRVVGAPALTKIFEAEAAAASGTPPEPAGVPVVVPPSFSLESRARGDTVAGSAPPPPPPSLPSSSPPPLPDDVPTIERLPAAISNPPVVPPPLPTQDPPSLPSQAPPPLPTQAPPKIPLPPVPSLPLPPVPMPRGPPPRASVVATMRPSPAVTSRPNPNLKLDDDE